MNGPVEATTTEQRAVHRVDYGINREGRDVALQCTLQGCHFVSFPTEVNKPNNLRSSGSGLPSL